MDNVHTQGNSIQLQKKPKKPRNPAVRDNTDDTGGQTSRSAKEASTGPVPRDSTYMKHPEESSAYRERLEGRLPGDGGEGEMRAAVQGYRVSGMQEG